MFHLMFHLIVRDRYCHNSAHYHPEYNGTTNPYSCKASFVYLLLAFHIIQLVKPTS